MSFEANPATLDHRVTAYLQKCDSAVAGEHGHTALFKTAAILTWGFALSPEQAFPYIQEYNARCLPPWNEHDLKRKLEQAVNHSSHQKPRGHLLGQDLDYRPTSQAATKTQPTWPIPDLERIDAIVSSGPSLYDLWEQSPIRFNDDYSHAEDIIDCLLPGDPLICCGKASDQFATRRREIWRGHLSRVPFMVPGAMLSVIGQTQDGRLSEHTKEATARKIYQVVEFDFSETNKNGNETVWTALLRQWRGAGIETVDACASLLLYLRTRLATLACVAFSGGKSLHGWFRVYELTEAEQRDFMRDAVALGADRATYTRSQFVRIPDGQRNDGRRQTCYFLDPREAITE
jgi:hypothetical protein